MEGGCGGGEGGGGINYRRGRGINSRGGEEGRRFCFCFLIIASEFEHYW